jgi:UDP-N-acetylmuramoyl-tripeptide--D-alanyl-D-alanine ligase
VELKASLFLLCAGTILFAYRRNLSYLRYFQQEEYNNKRFWSWLRTNRAADTRATGLFALVILTTVLSSTSFVVLLASALALAALIITAYYIEGDPRSTGKIKLNMTERATKTSWLSFGILAAISAIPLMWLCCPCGVTNATILKTALVGIVVAQATPFALMLSTIALSPAEKRLQQRFVGEAKQILNDVHPFTIGITGSYGKTGAKAALGDLLNQTLGSTFWPKKSINTVMGITRTIRETMKPTHKYAVIEMGAYNIGSIKRLCDFTPPRAALVTAVGIMHLERFGSPENVYKAKSEIAQAVPADGILVCNGDSPNARRMATEYAKKTTLLYGFDLAAGQLDAFATDIAFDEKGTTFTIHWKGHRYPGRTPLLGRPALLNALGAFTMACALGAKPAFAVACLGNLTPVDNRLVLDKTPTVSYLRDAYNSNPTGFDAALEVLRALPASRRIVITPGMIELGDQQFEQNKILARVAATSCDLFFLVGHTNREAILAGLQEAQFPTTKTILSDTRDEAFALLADHQKTGDLILIENDLGDLHEGKVRF